MRLYSALLPAKVYGPYLLRRKGKRPRRVVTIEYDDGHKASMTYARFLYQEQVGRILSPDEHVDHIDEDCMNDAVSNLQLLTNAANALKHNGPMEMITFLCPMCLREATKPARFVRHNRQLGKAGPFCGRQCAGRYASRRTPRGRGARSRA